MKSHDTALLMIDIQNDFCPGGALAVEGGDEVVAAVNSMQRDYDVLVLTQDWHPADHSSFAQNHQGAEPFSITTMPYGDQVLWPTHCVQGSHGAEFHRDLVIDRADLIIRKGFRSEIDSYSAFFENDRQTRTGLTGYLRDRGVKNVVLTGLATDFCVYYSAMDALKSGFKVKLITNACRAIDMDGSLASALDAMRAAGVEIA
ncbi:MAG: bifunctional nicotinamidase/pyrazinamidase [Hyphomicrobiales bacterium]|nr:bifunctional nicotinamidase/pyrazinamidase [Hyphomicrobiales bacterium]